MKRFTLLTMSTLGILSLSACTIIIGGDDDSRFDDAVGVSISENFETPARQDSVDVNETVFYRVDLSGNTAVDSDLIIIEADAEGEDDALEVAVYGEDGEELLASVSPDYFGSPDSVSASALSSQQLNPTSNCRGPCVAIRPSAEDLIYISVRSLEGVEDYSLFVVAADFVDATEPNDSNREPAILGEDQLAAIEYVGDEDFIQSPSDVTQVSLSAVPPQLDLEFDVYTESGRYLGTGSTDSTYTLPENQPAQQLIISVASESSRAAVGGSANYGVIFE